MPKFTIGDHVETPRHGTGRVKSVWPAGRGAPAHYAVEVDGERNAIVFHEHELRAAPPPAGDNAVRCIDCGHGKPTTYISGAVRCAQFRNLRSARGLRQCSYFKGKA